MTSEVAVCNQALTLVGGNDISSLDDDSTEAKLCKIHYHTLRDAVLQAHNWSFAKRWDNLPAMADPPDGEFASAFRLRDDVLTVLQVGRNGHYPTWEVEGNAILTNDSECWCQVIYRVEDPAKYPAMFEQALILRIAATLAIPIAESRVLKREIMEDYRNAVQMAATRDNMQGTPRRLRSKWLSQARYRQGNNWSGPTV